MCVGVDNSTLFFVGRYDVRWRRLDIAEFTALGYNGKKGLIVERLNGGIVY